VRSYFGVFSEVGFPHDPMYPEHYHEGLEVRPNAGCNLTMSMKNVDNETKGDLKRWMNNNYDENSNGDRMELPSPNSIYNHQPFTNNPLLPAEGQNDPLMQHHLQHRLKLEVGIAVLFLLPLS